MEAISNGLFWNALVAAPSKVMATRALLSLRSGREVSRIIVYLLLRRTLGRVGWGDGRRHRQQATSAGRFSDKAAHHIRTVPLFNDHQRIQHGHIFGGEAKTSDDGSSTHRRVLLY